MATPSGEVPGLSGFDSFHLAVGGRAIASPDRGATLTLRDRPTIPATQFISDCVGTRPSAGPFAYSAAGCTIHVAKPQQSRDLWLEYLDGARANYRRFGVESVLEYDTVRTGEATTWFFAAVDSCGTVLGGMRVQGPYTCPDQAHALTEWAGREGTEQLRLSIQDRIPHGVVEMKTGWVAPNAPRKRELTSALARIFLHAIRLTGVRYALGTVATHAVPRWSTTGGEICTEVTPVAYPDMRYRTVPMWWDREKELPSSLAVLMDDEHDRLRNPRATVITAESVHAA